MQPPNRVSDGVPVVPSKTTSKQPPVAARPAITGLVSAADCAALTDALPMMARPPQQPLNLGVWSQVMTIGCSGVPWASIRPSRSMMSSEIWKVPAPRYMPSMRVPGWMVRVAPLLTFTTPLIR